MSCMQPNPTHFQNIKVFKWAVQSLTFSSNASFRPCMTVCAMSRLNVFYDTDVIFHVHLDLLYTTTTQCLSTEINYSLTQTPNLPIRRESTTKVECNCFPLLPHPPCPPPTFSFKAEFHSNTSAVLSKTNQTPGISPFPKVPLSH